MTASRVGLAILVDLGGAAERRQRRFEIALARAQRSEVELQLLDPVARARLALVGPVGVEPFEEGSGGERRRALERVAPLAVRARAARLLERSIEIPGVAGERVGRG